MNPYLNARQNARKPSETPLTVFYALMAVSSATTLKDFAANGEWTTVYVGIAMILAFAWGVYRNVRKMLCRRNAQQIAHMMEQLSEEKVTFDKLEALMPGKKSVEQIKQLLAKGYLQNMYIDWTQSTLHLTAPSRQTDSFIKVICPTCNAENMIRRGRISRCEYCEQILTVNFTED